MPHRWRLWKATCGEEVSEATRGGLPSTLVAHTPRHDLPPIEFQWLPPFCTRECSRAEPSPCLLHQDPVTPKCVRTIGEGQAPLIGVGGVWKLPKTCRGSSRTDTRILPNARVLVLLTILCRRPGLDDYHCACRRRRMFGRARGVLAAE
jgi:hypothetical protein